MKNSLDLMEEADYMAMLNPLCPMGSEEKSEFEYHREEIIWWAKRIREEEKDIRDSIKHLNFHISQIQALY